MKKSKKKEKYTAHENTRRLDITSAQEVIGQRFHPPQSMMSQKRRELNLRLIGAEADNKKVLYYLYVLDRLTRCDEVLGWLVARGFTGKNFASYIEAIEQAGGGVLEIAKTALKDINQLREKPPILVGKDIR